MKVLIKIDTTIGGVRYLVNPGEQLPVELLNYWTAEKALDSMIACGVVEAVKPVSHTMSDHPEIVTKKDNIKK